MKTLSLLFLCCGIVVAAAQSSKLTIVQAANQPALQSTVATQPAATVAVVPNQSADLLKVLQEMKAANEETLKKQQSTLERLDELQKAAEQIKIFAHRG